ncbi:hypothetical protein K402DRAFT_120521 [Aulographum hederae CBS 113979]|uniref:Uncharacterized protein n=1 Tax=Aulographum hederae CBS 113979 TaxID=1176131 RepID=A0A6G1GVE4_9PEZI|nr:hypothetical protein K402DRAFT_120521 [Aulographum hederae CBS 113979]
MKMRMKMRMKMERRVHENSHQAYIPPSHPHKRGANCNRFISRQNMTLHRSTHCAPQSLRVSISHLLPLASPLSPLVLPPAVVAAGQWCAGAGRKDDVEADKTYAFALPMSPTSSCRHSQLSPSPTYPFHHIVAKVL